jgi:hypothetical protein
MRGVGVGGEGNTRGAKTVDFKHGTEWGIRAMKQGSPFQVSYFF